MIKLIIYKFRFGKSEMAQHEKVLATKPNGLNSVPRMYTVKGEAHLPQLS